MPSILNRQKVAVFEEPVVRNRSVFALPFCFLLEMGLKDGRIRISRNSIKSDFQQRNYPNQPQSRPFNRREVEGVIPPEKRWGTARRFSK